jgi:preprotein translocase subunit SecA
VTHAALRSLPMPGLIWGAYPERRKRPGSAATHALESLIARVRTPEPIARVRYDRFVALVRVAQTEQARAGAEDVRTRARALQARLVSDGLRDEVMAQCFALVAEVCRREVGQSPFDMQLLAARILLDGRLAEMATGEGKTLAVALAAATGALAGMPVHVITANDYLVQRDASGLRPVYAALGLTVGAVTQTLDADGRRAAYRCDVTYCTAKELGFDYLRDQLAVGRKRSELQRRVARLDEGSGATLLLRGLCMAIVDEADSVLIDEARVPLIISRPQDGSQELAHIAQALSLARRLSLGEHFRLDGTTREVGLSDAGRARLETAANLATVWRNRRHREEIVCTALVALHLYARDRDYIIRDGRVCIVDPTTGRIAEGRTWSRGLHQLIELKEGCEPTPEYETAAQITFQRLFRRYHRLCGLSGTLREARAELRSVYGLDVVRVPHRLPCRREKLASRLVASRDEQWCAVAARVAEVHGTGRPILIGTDSVADSEALSQRLAAAGLPHVMLNAHNDQIEADVVALAGNPGCITVATNMAGRGTDIPLAAGMAERGGLHVICCQHNASRRIDRQLEGRCARQGDPGSVETILSLDAPLLARKLPPRLRRALAVGMGGKRGGLAERCALWAARLAQRSEEYRERAERRQLMRADDEMEKQLAFGGFAE